MGLEQHYRTLGLEPGASAAAIKEAYRDLAKVWHPDRFANDDRLRDKAAEKLREINSAYQALRDGAGAAAQAEAPKPQPLVKQPVASPPPPIVEPRAVPRPHPRPRARSGGSGLLLLALLVGVGVFAWFKLRDNGTEEARTVEQPPPTPPPPAKGTFTIGSTEAEVLAVMGPPDRTFPMEGVIWFWDMDQVHFRNGRVDSWRQSFDRRLKVRLDPTDPAAAERGRKRGYFELGSTPDEVLGVQGTPDEIAEHIGLRWSYGMSNVTFTEGRVSGWWQAATGDELRLPPGAPDTR